MPTNMELYNSFCGNKILQFMEAYTSEFKQKAIKELEEDINDVEQKGFKIGFTIPRDLLKEKFMTRLDSVIKKIQT
jgi:hypothetical protein